LPKTKHVFAIAYFSVWLLPDLMNKDRYIKMMTKRIKIT